MPMSNTTDRPGSSPFYLQIGSKLFTLTNGAELTADGLPELGAAGQAFARVSAHPQHTEILGLENQTKGRWTARTNSGEIRPVEPGQRLKLAAGVRIDFGGISGNIVEPLDAAGPQPIKRHELETFAAKLRRSAKEGLLTEAEYKQLHLSFFVRDARGQAWTVGLRSGNWNRGEGEQWTPGQPPEELFIASALLLRLKDLTERLKPKAPGSSP